MRSSRLGLLLAAALVAGMLASQAQAAGSPSAQPSPRPRSVAMNAPRRLAPAVRGLRAARARPATAAGRSTLAPASSFGFDGIPRVGAFWPADPTGAVGADWYFTAVNTYYALFDLAGAPVLGPSDFAGIAAFPAGTDVFDPKVVYDQYDDTFVFVYLAVNDAAKKSWVIVVAIPNATAGDQTTWCVRTIPSDQLAGDGKQWGDYPGLGYDVDRVTVTTNQFDFGGAFSFEYAQILSFPKTALYDCSQTLAFRVFTGKATRNPDGSPAFTIQPAASVGAAATSQYLVSFEQNSAVSGKSLTVWKVGLAGSKLTLSKASLPVGKALLAPFGTQGGGSLTNLDTFWDPGDLRLVNAFYDADLNRVYTAHAVGKDLLPDPVTGNYPESVIRWYEVAPGASLSSSSVSRKGIVGTPEADMGWPVVATDGSGNLFITCNLASAVTGQFLSAYAVEIPPGSATATSVLLAPGTAEFEALSGPERWGDYNGISRDPLDATKIVMVNQYAVSDGSGSTADWQQIVDVVSHV